MFALAVLSSCVRLLSATACEFGLDAYRFDAEQAFVQYKLDWDIFLRLPKGCGSLPGKIVRLNKRLYGLKQASWSLHAYLTISFQLLGFQQCLVETCVFCLVAVRVVMITVMHVDDVLIVGMKVRSDVF